MYENFQTFLTAYICPNGWTKRKKEFGFSFIYNQSTNQNWKTVNCDDYRLKNLDFTFAVKLRFMSHNY